MDIKKLLMIQRPMLRVCYGLTPLVFASIYLFGWRSLLLIAVALIFGIASEAAFTLKKGRPVTSAVFVTCLIFSLSLPPTIPFWMALIGIIVGVIFGKMVFGGFGRNVFNPAMVGRCFIYIAFPQALTNNWVEPLWGGMGGFAHWTRSVDAITRATPLAAIREGLSQSLCNLFLGNVPGSMGETSALLIIIGGIYIIFRKAAPWRLALSCLLGGIIASGIISWDGLSTIRHVAYTLFSGAFLFGCAFVVTEPVSGPKTRPGQWIYGLIVGGLTVLLRRYSNFSEGFMFSVLLMNAFVPLLDQALGAVRKGRRAASNA